MKNKGDMIKKGLGVKKPKNLPISRFKNVHKARKVYIALFLSTDKLFVKQT